MTDNVLLIENLVVEARAGSRKAAIVNGVDLAVARGETLGIVGESGSGKSMTVLAASGLVSADLHVGGRVRLLGEELTALPARRVRELRGRHMGFVFQDPLSSLNPLMTVGRQICEAYRRNFRKNRTQGRDRAIELLGQVGIPDPEHRVDDYPHHFSGGMRQRVMIAMALACEPEVLIADEPTTALDVTIQAQVVALVQDLQKRLGTAVVWITHDLGLVAELADRVAVMYGGRVIETAPVTALYERPGHPYTRALLDARPHPDLEQPLLNAIPGAPPSPFALPRGCAFHPRCPVRSDERCASEVPPLHEIGPGHAVRTFCSIGVR